MQSRQGHSQAGAEIKQLENSKKIAESKLAALRMQMNPHFIFNSLNAINNLIAKNDTKNASFYLSKFSKLVRQIFENAASEWITLEKELKTLDLYIELEKIRFENRIDVSVQVSPDLNCRSIKIPNLLIQPFVENAIWHGLLHKENGKGELCLRFWTSEDMLCISVEDNGIGLVASGLMKNGRTLTHAEKGLKTTRERIEILNDVCNARIVHSLSEIQDEQGNVSGTRATVCLALRDEHPPF